MARPRKVCVLMASVAVVAAQVGELLMEDTDLLIPRFTFGSPMDSTIASPMRPRRRQLDSECSPGNSPCNDIGISGCCPNDNYCFINLEGEKKCCANGSRCDDPCALDTYRCVISSKLGCCPRACPASTAFQCPESYGGSCCDKGSSCLPDKRCQSTVDPATVNTVSPSPTGCTTGQFSCPASVGGGCCENGMACTAIATKLYCASANGGPSSVRSSFLATDVAATGATTGAGPPSTTSEAPTPLSNEGGLSRGAKAGVGVGVAIGALAIIGSIVWFIIGRRRKARVVQQYQQQQQSGTGVKSPTAPPQSQTSSPGAASGGMDYFTQSGRSEPSTYREAARASGMTALSPSRTAVPLTPQSPGDIVTPVEIAESNVQTPGARSQSSGGGAFEEGEYSTSTPPPPPVARPVGHGHAELP
ncbi:MAG: hypothetical protein M1837_007067 [Sclerophora amabilis]|nr:MAG: hypothetical protein M1837_007067 [Sclerophora amabilis]